jgi:TPR repeat protein
MKQMEMGLGELAFQAESGDACAQYRMATLFMLGETVEQDLNAAYLWMARAASAQHQGAQNLVEHLATSRSCLEQSAMATPRSGITANAMRHLRTAAMRRSRSLLSPTRTMVSMLASLRQRLEANAAFRPRAEVVDFPARRTQGFEFPEVL